MINIMKMFIANDTFSKKCFIANDTFSKKCIIANDTNLQN